MTNAGAQSRNRMAWMGRRIHCVVHTKYIILPQHKHVLRKSQQSLCCVSTERVGKDNDVTSIQDLIDQDHFFSSQDKCTNIELGDNPSKSQNGLQRQ